MDTLSPEELANAADIAKNIIRRAAKSVQGGKHAGSIPGEISDYIEELLRVEPISWLQLFRNKIVNTQRHRPQRSMRRLNRRSFGIPRMPFPGTYRDPTYTIAFCVDTSGSMSSKDIGMALAELRAIQKSDPGIKIHVAEVDMAVQHTYEMNTHTEINLNVHGRGGTTFDHGLVWATTKKPDMVIYATDGYASTPAVDVYPRCPLLWLLTPQNGLPADTQGSRLVMQDIVQNSKV